MSELVGDPDEGLDPDEHVEEPERTQTDHLNKSLLASFAASLDRMGMQGACPMLGDLGGTCSSSMMDADDFD